MAFEEPNYSYNFTFSEFLTAIANNLIARGESPCHYCIHENVCEPPDTDCKHAYAGSGRFDNFCLDESLVYEEIIALIANSISASSSHKN